MASNFSSIPELETIPRLEHLKADSQTLRKCISSSKWHFVAIFVKPNIQDPNEPMKIFHNQEFCIYWIDDGSSHEFTIRCKSATSQNYFPSKNQMKMFIY